MTRAEFLTKARQPHKIPKNIPPSRGAYLIEYFNNIRSMVGDIEKPITMDIIRGWQDHTYVKLDRWERDGIFVMDAALRRSYHDVVKFHAQRDADMQKLKAGKGTRRHG